MGAGDQPNALRCRHRPVRTPAHHAADLTAPKSAQGRGTRSRTTGNRYNAIALNKGSFSLVANSTRRFFQIRLNQHTFADAFPKSSTFVGDQWSSLARLVKPEDWKLAENKINVCQVDGVRLFIINWEFRIETMDTTTNARLCAAAEDLKKQLIEFVKGEPLSIDVPRSEMTKERSAEVVRCWTKGIIG